MPFKSLAQQAWGHTPQGEQALGGPSHVAEWDQATKGKEANLPEHIHSNLRRKMAHAGGHSHGKDCTCASCKMSR